MNQIKDYNNYKNKFKQNLKLEDKLKIKFLI